MARRRPDWTALPSDLVASIGGLLIADDVTDFIRFRAVCHPWRALSEDTKRRADCHHPRSWIMLTNPKLSPTEPVEFYNTSTHKSFWFDLTGYLDEHSVFCSFACLMILQNKNTQGFALLNPFMRSLTQLPSKIESDCPKAPSKIEDLIHDSFMNRLSDVYVTSSSTIILRSSSLKYLAWTKPDDDYWAYAEFKVLRWSNVLFYKDRILVVDVDEEVVQINFANGMSSQPQLEVAIPDHLLDDARHLIECNGSVLMVSFIIDDYEEQHFWESFEMYKLDLKNKICVPSANIGDRSVPAMLGDCSIFLGENRTFSVCGKKGLVPAKCIYFCNQYYGENVWYNLSTRRLQFSSKKPFLRPNPLVKKLMNYCVRPDMIEEQQDDGSSLLHYED